jgi:hypothetical protein
MRPNTQEACTFLLHVHLPDPDESFLQYEEDYDLHEFMLCNLGAIDGLTAPVQPENFIHASFGRSLILGEFRCSVYCIVPCWSSAEKLMISLWSCRCEIRFQHRSTITGLSPCPNRLVRHVDPRSLMSQYGLCRSAKFGSHVWGFSRFQQKVDNHCLFET